MSDSERGLAMVGDAAWRAIEVLVFDIDDTLTRDGVLEAEAFAALHALHASGLTLIAATGRPIGWAESVASLWPVDAAIGENGAGVVRRRGRVIETSYALEGAARDAAWSRRAALEEELRAHDATIVIASDGAGRRLDLAIDIGERRRLDESAVGALRAFVEARGFRTVTSSIHLHAMPGTWDKASGARRAIALLRDTASESVDLGAPSFAFVGDSPNDEAAFAAFGLSFGVANVRDHWAKLTHRPRFVTSRDRGRGFAELADHILRARSAR